MREGGEKEGMSSSPCPDNFCSSVSTVHVCIGKGGVKAGVGTGLSGDGEGKEEGEGEGKVMLL